MTATAELILPASADGTPEWLKQRTQGIGGTDAAGLYLGTKSRFALWREKTGRAEREDVPESLQELFDFGHERELPLTRRFSRKTGLISRNTGTWARRDAPWAMANPDRFVGSNGILEIKTTGVHTEDAEFWRSGRVAPRAWVQAHWYAYVTGRTDLHFVAEIDRHAYVLGPYTADTQLIEELAEIAAEFWATVEADQAPAEDTPEPERPIRYVPPADGSELVIEPWDEMTERLARLATLKADAKYIAGEIKAIEDDAKEAMGGAEVLRTADGRVLATWRTQTRRGSVDTKALAAAAGLDVEDYRKPATTARTFLIKEA